MTVSEWFAAARCFAGVRWEYFASWYSFQAAYEAGMTPGDAIMDCERWLEDKA